MLQEDGRGPSHSGLKWSTKADVENLAWDPHCEHCFVVSLEDGTVNGFDKRASSLSPSFTLHAHDGEVCSISYNTHAPNVYTHLSLFRLCVFSKSYSLRACAAFGYRIWGYKCETLGSFEQLTVMDCYTQSKHWDSFLGLIQCRVPILTRYWRLRGGAKSVGDSA
ncbi:unnamed protein product [Cochlearia groenlandica]